MTRDELYKTLNHLYDSESRHSRSISNIADYIQGNFVERKGVEKLQDNVYSRIDSDHYIYDIAKMNNDIGDMFRALLGGK